MEEKIKSINTLLTAFENRNELLHEEIKKNEEAMKSLKEELEQILEGAIPANNITDTKLKMAS